MVIMTLFVSSGVMAMFPITESWESNTLAQNVQQQSIVSDSMLNVSIPYVDDHYGSADGIIDPKEYAYSSTDPVTGITVYLEHNSSMLYVGLSARTSGWIAIGWNNYTDDFTTLGINGTDMIYGYSPGTSYHAYPRVLGTEAVTVHYVLKTRNGTLIEEGNVPNDESTTPISEDFLLQKYKDEIIGMRVGEVRHFVIPAEDAYDQPTNPMYGEDLEYIITLTRIDELRDNAADYSNIVYSDEHGTSTFQHAADANQSRIVAANGTDDGTTTQLEYFIQLNSTDPNDIALLNSTNINYPMMLMFGNNEDIHSLPVQHTDWSNPPMMQLIPNESPLLIVDSPIQDASLTWVTSISLNATDDSFVRRAFYKLDSENWTELFYDFQTTLWETQLDLSSYDNGDHAIWFNATDPSNITSIIFVNFTIDRPYIPLLGMKLDVTRTVVTMLYHLTETRDEFTVTNNGSAPITAIEIFLPSDMGEKLLSIIGSDSGENELEIVRLEDVDGLLHWRVHFRGAVGFQESYTFTVSSYFHSLHTLTVFDTEMYNVTLYQYPIVPYVLTNAEFLLEFRAGDSLPDATQYNPEGAWTNLAPMQMDKVTFEMKSYTPLIESERHTEITVDPWGWLSYKETITLYNVGPAKENFFLFTVPAYATSITIYDEVGILANSQPNAEWVLNKTVNLQVNLLNDRFGADAFWPGYQYTFHVDYTIQLTEYQTAIFEGSEIEFPMGTLGDVPITKHVVDIVLPMSVTTVSVDGEYRLLHGIFDNTIRYTSYNTSRQNPPEITLVYQVSIATTSRPVIFALLIGLVAAVYVVFRRVEMINEISGRVDDDDATIDTRQTGAPPELLREFANIYSKKTALGMDLEKLESSRRKGKVSKKEYMIRDKDIKAQLQEIDSNLPDLKETLMRHGGKYRDLVSQLELQDEKVEGAKAGLRQLLLRKKKQRISRVAFEKSRQDYLKTIKRATSATDRILLSIQEEAGDI